MASDAASTAEQESTVQPTPESIITKGKTFLAVPDYFNAVGMLADGCRMLVDKFGETADELAEPYLFYGRALLGLAREEQAVLGTGLPGVQDAEGEEEDDEEGEDEEPAADAPGTFADAKEEEKKPSAENGADAKEEKTEKKEAEAVANGEASTSAGTVQQNGDAHENGNGQDEDGDAEDVDNEEDDDGSSNLQIAWEVLELSKMIVQKRSDSAEKNKFLAETHRLLGEVALESGNQSGAIGDLSTCLELMRELEKVTSRQLAEVHYQLGLAYSLGSGYSKSIEHYEEALKCLDQRINELKDMKEPQQDTDSKYDPEEEIKEIQALIPEINEKISDVNDMKQQTCKVLLETIKEHIGEGSCSNGAGPSGASTSSDAGASTSSSSAEAKPASDINHLIRKKRKNEDGEPEGSPCKK